MNAWSKVAGLILRKKYFFLAAILLLTSFFAYQIGKLELSYKSQNILPDRHSLIVAHKKFRKIFPESENLILISIKDSTLFSPKNFKTWQNLTSELDRFAETEKVISIGNLPMLKLDKKNGKGYVLDNFRMEKFSPEDIENYYRKLRDSLPFYRNIVLNDSDAVNMFVYVKPGIVETKKRRDFIFNKLIPEIKKFERQTGIKTHTSGLLYIRTLNGQILKRELPLFIALTLLITSLILWFFFRSFPPILISLVIVMLASIWVSGFMGLLGFKITILTAIIPALIIVIGVPNTIFLINKYQQEIIKHRNQARSLQRVITKTGNAILMTNLTTALGFLSFTVVNNPMLREFGISAGFGIFSLFILSILLIPIIYSFLRIPRYKHLRHLEKKWLRKFIDWLIYMVKRKKVVIFSTALLAIVVSLVGVNRIKISGSILADLPKNQDFYSDIKYFEEEFGGILPLDFMVDAKKKKKIFSQKSLKKIDEFQKQIDALNELSPSVSIVNAIKYAKQVFYKGNPEYYALPSSHERNFIMPYYKKSKPKNNLLAMAYVDTTGRYARITTFMKDLDIKRMERVEDFLELQKKRIFPSEQFDVLMTGQARLFLEGTKYLLNNLIWSLGLTIILISLVIYFMFGSKRILIVSMIANLLPLLVTAGLMGFLNIPLKPSTILIFGITLGISVDDTIHFLTKYREELKKHHGRVKKAVYNALKETGVSMFYTSVVLFFGFLVFLISNYGGTKALGGLVSFTLMIAMFSNLLLLPSLILFLEDVGMKKKRVEIYERN